MKKILRVFGYIGFWLSWPALWLYLKRGTRTRVVVVYGDKLLVVKTWLGTGKWQLPGGGLHKGEPPKSGAVREVFEETGVMLKQSELHPVGDGLKQQTRHGLSFRYYGFEAKISRLPDLRPQMVEISDVAFVPLSTLNETCASKDLLEILDTWRAGS